METPRPTRRRWFRFSLRTLLVLVTLVCFVCGYVSWAMNWIRQRNAYLQYYNTTRWTFGFRDRPIAAPGSLRILGEDGVSSFQYVIADEDKLVAASKLFPEARIEFCAMYKEGARYQGGPASPPHFMGKLPYFQNGVLFRGELLKLVNDADYQDQYFQYE